MVILEQHNYQGRWLSSSDLVVVTVCATTETHADASVFN